MAFWASLVAQLVKNLPAMQETQVQSQGWEDHLKKWTGSNILAWRIPCTVQSMGSTKIRTQLSDFHFYMTLSIFACAYWPFLVKELSSHILHPFSSGFFYHWVVIILYMCSTQAPYQICKNFLQFCGLYFHFPDDVFCSIRIFFILMSSLSFFFFLVFYLCFWNHI